MILIVSSGAAVDSASQLSQASILIRKSGTTMEVREFVCSLDYRRLINDTPHRIVFSLNQRFLKEDLKQLSVLHFLRIHIF